MDKKETLVTGTGGCKTMQVLPNLLLSLLACLSLATSPSPLVADEQALHYDRIQLHTSATAEVENDTLVAVLSAQKEGSEPGLLTDSVNRLISQAISLAKESEGIKVQTLGYQTSPIYQQQRLTGWRVRQSIRLQSMHNDKLSILLNKLQSTLALESISYAISPAQREKVEEALTLQAIDAFHKRADLVTKQFGRSQYRLVTMTLQSSDRPTQPMRMRANMMAMEGVSTAPSLAAGSQTLRVEVMGTIELQLDQ
ncbi:MAG: SIMPL domain-containing protein [Candidatus Thiodiazotropha sp.]